MDQDNLEREGEESLTEALEGLETAQNTVEALQEFVRKNGEDEEKTQEGEETVPEKKIWSKEKAEAHAKTERIENEYAAGEKTNEAVVKGVKGVVANAHESKQNEKQGRQKWGMFETHYQREKHITLEESLSEIERYSKHGEVPKQGYAPRKKEAGNVAVRQKLEANIRKDKQKGRKPGVAPLGKQKVGIEEEDDDASTKESGKEEGEEKESGVTDKIEEKKPDNKAVKSFAKNLKKGGNQGSKFFEEYKKREEKKYRPTFGMKNYY